MRSKFYNKLYRNTVYVNLKFYKLISNLLIFIPKNVSTYLNFYNKIAVVAVFPAHNNNIFNKNIFTVLNILRNIYPQLKFYVPNLRYRNRISRWQTLGVRIQCQSSPVAGSLRCKGRPS